MPIQTVTGSLLSEQLGHCQMHEHLIVREGPATRANRALLIDDEARSAAELSAYRAAGGRSVVDCQPGGAGRDALALRRVSERSGVSIVAVTGYHMPAFYPAPLSPYGRDESALRDLFLAELTDQMTDGAPTGIRAGAVKAAIGARGLEDYFRAPLAAAARAAAKAGVPLILHTEAGAGALDALALCERSGLAPDRVLICHADRQAGDRALHEAIACAGAMLEYDTIARPKYHGDAEERALIRHMLERGHIGRLLLSLDTTAARLASYGGAPGLCHLLDAFLPSLGVTARELHQLCVLNPRNCLSPITK